MSLWLEHFLTGYFQLCGLVCGWSGSRLGRLLSSTFLVLVLIELVGEMEKYFTEETPDNESVPAYFAKVIMGVNMAYKMIHAWIAFSALFECRRFRYLLEELPPVKATPFIYRHLILEFILFACNAFLVLSEYTIRGIYLENLRYAYSLQAVRARYLQMMVLVDRLDGQLEQLHHRVIYGSSDYKTLRLDYAHLAKVTRSLSHLFGLSLLLLNVLCLGDWIIVCNVYFMVAYLQVLPATLFLFGQVMFVVCPTLIKIWSICAACHRCVSKSKHLQQQLKDLPGQTPLERSQIEGFALQIMQDPIQIDVCGIYHLNLQTLAGVYQYKKISPIYTIHLLNIIQLIQMFFFILEALVIFLQFVSLVRT